MKTSPPIGERRRVWLRRDFARHLDYRLVALFPQNGISAFACSSRLDVAFELLETALRPSRFVFFAGIDFERSSLRL
jgi:hypothetical protein